MYAPVQQRPLFAAVMLTALIAFQSVGWLLAWQGMQLVAKIEAHKTLSQAEGRLQEIVFHKKFVEKIKVGKKEIVLNGQLFDYRILSETYDSLRIALYHDHHEQALLSALGRVFNSENIFNSCPKPVAVWLAQWLGSAFLLPEKITFATSNETLFQKQDFAHLLLVAQSVPSIFAPPPEACAQKKVPRKWWHGL